MKLFYFKDAVGNFGDDLNPWIWYSLAPELFDEDGSSVLVGIGTLINSRAPAAPHKFAFGSGVGYHQLPPNRDQWDFYCVRGPLSAQQLGLDSSYAITDPAVLLTQIMADRPVIQSGKVAYMPHHASTRFADWEEVCKKAGIIYLDPAADMFETVLQIRQCKLLIAEAMHGAIVADAFRMPWIPVVCYDHILDFKWHDWCQSLQMQYQPQNFPRLWDMEKDLPFKKRFKAHYKRGLKNMGLWSKNWSEPIPKSNKAMVEDQVVQTLMQLASNGQTFLSEDRQHQESIERLLERLDLVRQDVASGVPLVERFKSRR